MERTWLPEELKPYEAARKALGVLLNRPKNNPEDPQVYRLLYREKVKELVRKSPDWRESVEACLGPRALAYLPENADPQEVLDVLENVNGWMGPSLSLSLYLQKRGSLDRVKESLNLRNEDKQPVPNAVFLKELKDLDLAEFLELVT